MQLRWLRFACKHSRAHQCSLLRGLYPLCVCHKLSSLGASRGNAVGFAMPLQFRLTSIAPPLGIFCKQYLVLALSSAPAFARLGDQSKGEDGLAEVRRARWVGQHRRVPAGIADLAVVPCVWAIAAELSLQGAPPWSRGNACRQPFKGGKKKVTNADVAKNSACVRRWRWSGFPRSVCFPPWAGSEVAEVPSGERLPGWGTTSPFSPCPQRCHLC